MTRIPVQRALVSVHDKAGLVDFGRRLQAAGVEIVSSGGTAAALASAGVPVILVSDVTKASEMLGGRVKTLHPSIHGGILARLTDPAHRRDLESQGIKPFGLVVVNLYPFEATVADPSTTWDEAIEQIDIGGVALIRAAAKNQDFVGIVTTPDQYGHVASEIEAGGLEESTRRDLARQAFFRTASYDAAIVNWFESGQEIPDRLSLALERESVLRYGENPHQAAGLYREAGSSPWWWKARLLQGKEMSFNNYLDAEAAWRLANDLQQVAPEQIGPEHVGPKLVGVVIVKHNNPCGVAVADDPTLAFRRAWECDPLSAFGGVVAVNSPIDQAFADELSGRFIEVVVAPQVTVDLTERPSLRVLEAPAPHHSDFDLRRIEDGVMVQRRDRVDFENWQVVGGRQPNAIQWSDLRLAWTVAAHTKSNSVVIATEGQAVGVGAGDQSRVGAVERAVARAGARAHGAVAASDAFFPFPDGVELLADAGVTAIVAPGGSKRDEEVAAVAEARGLAFVRAGHRHFRH